MSETDFNNPDKSVNKTTLNGPSIPGTRQEEYAFVSESYNGDGGYKNGNNLFQFCREDDFARRAAQNYYKNYIKPVLNSTITPVFSSEAVRVYNNEDMLDVFFEDVDLKKTKIQDFTKKAVHFASAHGVSFAVVDSFKDGEISESESDNINKRVMPYSYIKSGATVYDYAVDEYGALKEISFFDHIAVDVKGNKITYYKQWTREYSVLFVVENVKGDAGKTTTEKVEKGEKSAHGLGELPIVQLYSVDTDQILPDSPLYDLCRINLAIYNQDSEQRISERLSAFVQLVIPDNDPESSIDVGNSSIISIPLDSSNFPAYISPDPGVLKLLGESSDKNIGKLIEMADILGASAIKAGTAPKSGVALGYEFLGKSYTLKERARLAEDFEKELIRIFDLYVNKNIEFAVKYSDNYAPSTAELMIKKDSIEKSLEDPMLHDAIRYRLNIDLVEVLAQINNYDSETLKDLKEAIKTGKVVYENLV